MFMVPVVPQHGGGRGEARRKGTQDRWQHSESEAKQRLLKTLSQRKINKILYLQVKFSLYLEIFIG